MNYSYESESQKSAEAAWRGNSSEFLACAAACLSGGSSVNLRRTRRRPRNIGNQSVWTGTKTPMARHKKPSQRSRKQPKGPAIIPIPAFYGKHWRIITTTQLPARNHGIKPEQIVVGCGSSDVLRMAASAFLVPGATLIMAAPTCDLIAKYGRSSGATITEVPLRNDHAHDLEGMLKHSNKSGASGLIYVCNPNSPTGTLTTRKDLEEFPQQSIATISVGD